ncbi:MAG: hypothetical protein HYZ50_01340 [Deltaproteobacteria bacterium]|nr:hypothetical protein [Deltaproteobacteria bacterium]
MGEFTIQQRLLRGLGIFLLTISLYILTWSLITDFTVSLKARGLELSNYEFALKHEGLEKMNFYLEAILWEQKANGFAEQVLLGIIAVAGSGILLALSTKAKAS